MSETVPTQNRMGTEPIGRLLLKMSLPVMLSMFIHACYNIVDSIYVARIGENALTALSLSFPIQMLMISVAVGTGVGMNSAISRRLGEKRFSEANSTASNGLFLLTASSVVFLILGLTLVKPFFGMFTDDAEIYSMGVSYLSIVMIFCFGVFMQIGCERIIIATGNTVYPMLMQLAGAVTNIILDPILIFGYFGLPAMGVTGAALATAIGQFVGMALSFYLVFGKKHEVSISFTGFKPDKESIKDIYAVGAPNIALQSIGTVLVLGLNKILIGFTPTAVSVLGVYFKLNSFVFLPVFGLNSGAMSIMAYNFGAKSRARVIKTLKLNVISASGIMAFGTLIFMLFARELLLLFDASEDMLKIGVPALRIISAGFIIAAVCIGLSTLFQAVGKGSYSLIMSLMRQLIVILPVAYIFSRMFGLYMVWWAFSISEIVTLALTLYLFGRVNTALLKPLGGDL